MKKLIFLAMVIGLVTIASQAFSADWTLVGTTKQGKVYAHLPTVTHPSKDITCVWLKRVYTEETISDLMKKFGNGYEPLSHEKFLWEINCTEKKVHRTKRILYSKTGDIIASSNEIGEWEPIVPDSSGEVLHALVCMVGETRAGDAWVLWKKLGGSENKWMVKDPYPNYSMSKKAQVDLFNSGMSFVQQEVLRENVASFEVAVKYNSPDWISVYGKTVVELKCLPESVDPREGEMR